MHYYVSMKYSTMEDLNILVLGGLGRVGTIFISLLLKEQSAEHQRNCDEGSSPTKNKNLVTIFDSSPSSKNNILPNGVSCLPQRELCDLSLDLLSKFDVVVNTLPVSQSETVLELVSKSTCHTYVDVSSNKVDHPEQIDYSEQFARQNRLLLSCVGVAPGLDNLLVAELVEKRDARSVHIYLIEHTTDKCYIPSWCEEDAKISASDLPISFDGKSVLHHPTFSDPEVLETAAGTFSFYRFFGEEVLSLANTFPNLHIDHKAGGSEIEVAKDNLNAKSSNVVDLSSSLAHGENKEPQGVFGTVVVSDQGTAQVLLKSTAELMAEGRPGNHISYHTGAMMYYCLKHALKNPDLVGTMFPEMLPSKTRRNILKDVKQNLATTFLL